MKTTEQPSRRQLMSWAVAVLVVGAVGIIPWQLVPREALAQNPLPVPPEKEPVHEGKDERSISKAADAEANLQVAEARLKVAQAERDVADAVVGQAEAQAEQAVASREYRRKQLNRFGQLAEQGAIEQRLVDEEQDRYCATEAAAQSAEANDRRARGIPGSAGATTREAEAIRDGARAELRIARGKTPRPKSDLKTARTRLREARLDHGRSEQKTARAEIDRAEADRGKPVRPSSTEPRYSSGSRSYAETIRSSKDWSTRRSRRLTEARIAEREAEAAVGIARARLKAAEARLKFAEVEAAVAK